MSFLKWLIAGFVGALVGAGIWYWAASSNEATYNWMACLVGITTGLAVRLATEEADRGIKPGLVAIFIALPLLIYVKHEIALMTAANDPEIENFLDAAFEGSMDEESMICTVADEIALERIDAGIPIEWPEEMTYEDASWEEDYPADIWAEAKKKWQSLSDEDQAKRVRENEKKVRAVLVDQEREIGSRQIQGTFSPWDIVWFLFAAIAAFRLPAGPLSEL
ncbi:hypothetical protein [Thalassoglobus polymorphus]|uniref:Uncharacterized protein n=1 Tax=Thalassoglobus polymorphus TaxID=2527994 RepID=A0A517QIT3_9PLAN|nr:hypothetical protein [Thalassoglobus polymorphus]QDT31518.1 hypothetical protein Mal48_07520 [Thalassoglobus polymorphus]